MGVAFFHRLWHGPGIVYSPDSDVASYLIGAKAVFQRALWEEGSYALWNSAVNCGTPAHANPAAMYAFPTHWLYWFLSIERATNLAFLLSALAAGLGMYALAGRLCRQRVSAFVCGAGWMLCHRFLNMVHAGWYAGITFYALAPWFFWSLDRLFEKPGGRRAAGLAVVVWLCLTQAFIQLFYYAALGALVFSALRLKDKPRRERLSALAFAFTALLAGSLLAAPNLLPALEFVALSTRQNHDYAFFIRHAPTTADLATFLDPLKAAGPETWENNFYFGLWLYPLCLLAGFRRGRGVAALAAACLILPALCFDTPVLRLVYAALPGFGLFRLHARLLVFEQLLLLLLAGAGVDCLIEIRLAPALAALLGLLPLLDHAASLMPRTKAISEIFPEQPFYAALRRGRTAAIGRTAIPYGAAGYLGIDMANGYEPLNLAYFEDYFAVLKYGDPRKAGRAPVVWTDLEMVAKPELLRALDIENIVANVDLPLGRLGYRRIGKFEDIPVFSFYKGIVRVPVEVWEDPHPLGPAYFAVSVEPLAGEAASLAALASASDAREARVMELDRPPRRGLPGGVVGLVRRESNSYDYELSGRGENFLILSQIWYPGWTAAVDGRPTRLYRVNHALLGCFVPSGRHSLRLEMTSPRLKQGLVLAGLGLLALALLCLPS
ncbi:MAG: hypothetical protein HY077_03855 [Elusimicrobia bacterium]|nr:hypothetical protein [Elusimicrobiota bacterium]